MNTFITVKVVGSITRHLLTVAGGWLLAQGYADAAAVEAITGGAVALAGVAMAVREKAIR